MTGRRAIQRALCTVLCSEAYSVLSEPTLRERYNLQLEQALRDEDDDFTGERGGVLGLRGIWKWFESSVFDLR